MPNVAIIRWMPRRNKILLIFFAPTAFGAASLSERKLGQAHARFPVATNEVGEIGSPAASEARPRALSCSGHHCAQDIVDAGGIASSIPPEPVVNISVQAGGDQYLGRTPELRQLFIGQCRDVRVVDSGILAGGPAPRDPGPDG